MANQKSKKKHTNIETKKLIGLDDTLTLGEEALVAKGLAQIQRGETIPWSAVRRDLGL